MNSDIKPNIDTIKLEFHHDDEASSKAVSGTDATAAEKEERKNITERNLELADNINLVRVTEKNKISLRHLARKNFILDTLKVKPVFEETSDLYKVKYYSYL